MMHTLPSAEGLAGMQLCPFMQPAGEEGAGHTYIAPVHMEPIVAVPPLGLHMPENFPCAVMSHEPGVFPPPGTFGRLLTHMVFGACCFASGAPEQVSLE